MRRRSKDEVAAEVEGGTVSSLYPHYILTVSPLYTHCILTVSLQKEVFEEEKKEGEKEGK